MENHSQTKSIENNKIWTKPFVFALIIVFILGIISLLQGPMILLAKKIGWICFL